MAMEEQSKVHMPSFKDFLYWITFVALPVFIGSVAIIRHSFWWFLLYIGIIAGGVLGLWYQFICTGCPYYKQSADGCKCMFIWGLPRFYSAKNRPYRLHELILGYGGLGLVFVYPFLWLIFRPLLLVLYVLSLGLFVLTVVRYECPRCAHTNCPLNKASEQGQ
jgi:hypothetical protein